MNTEMLLKEFTEMLEYEKRAEAFYSHYIEHVEDEQIKGVLTTIRNEETSHIKIVERLIAIIS